VPPQILVEQRSKSEEARSIACLRALKSGEARASVPQWHRRPCTSVDVLQVRAEVETKAGKNFAEFVAVEYSTQLVAGTNYFVKVRL